MGSSCELGLLSNSTVLVLVSKSCLILSQQDYSAPKEVTRH